MVRGASWLAEPPELSKPARQRLKWLDYYREHGSNARLTCRHFDIPPQTFYRWKGRYDPKDLTSLEGRSHRPKRVRQPTWSKELAQAVGTAVTMEPKQVLGFVNHFAHNTDIAYVTRGKNGGIIRGTKPAKVVKVSKKAAKVAAADTSVVVADDSTATS